MKKDKTAQDFKMLSRIVVHKDYFLVFTEGKLNENTDINAISVAHDSRGQLEGKILTARIRIHRNNNKHG